MKGNEEMPWSWWLMPPVFSMAYPPAQEGREAPALLPVQRFKAQLLFLGDRMVTTSFSALPGWGRYSLTVNVRKNILSFGTWKVGQGAAESLSR